MMMLPREFSINQRDVLIEHLDGCEVPIDRTNKDRYRWRTITTLVSQGYLEHERVAFPRFTKITEKGRKLLGLVLADYADALVRAQKLGALINETGEITEPKDLDESLKFILHHRPLNAGDREFLLDDLRRGGAGVPFRRKGQSVGNGAGVAGPRHHLVENDQSSAGREGLAHALDEVAALTHRHEHQGEEADDDVGLQAREVELDGVDDL